jgi:predicted ABC-type ATPase
VAAIKAGKLMLDEIDRFRKLRVDFAFETTLSGKTYIRLLKEMKEGGHKIHVYFLWLRNVELALDRVKNRVAMGGHNVPAETVRRRFDRGLHNLLHLYRVLADSWIIFDNSEEVPRVIAKETSGVLTVVDGKLFKGIKTKVEIS